MKIIRKIVLLAVSFLACSPALADTTLPGQCTVYRPEALCSNIIRESDILEFLKTGKSTKPTAWGQTKNTGLYWNVFSDRSNNITYESPKAGSPKFKELKLGLNLRIAEIRNGYALVYKENNSGVGYPTISHSATSYGWIPMNHLLLWTDCPANDNYIYKKALIVGNIDNAKNDNRLGYIFNNPETGDGKGKLQSTMNFFYQMKTDENGMVLLSKESRVAGKLEALYGWVSRASFVAWEQRTCLEPNWDSQVVADLRGSSIPVLSKTTGKELTSIIIGSKKNHVSTKPETIYRLEPAVLRYPILQANSSDYIATIFAKEGEATNTATISELANSEEKLSKAVDDRSVVNVIVVIDGTRGMEKFFPFALEAVRRAESFLKRDDVVRTVKVGGVIYRDYDDGQYVTEALPMCRANDPRVERFFRGGEYGIKSSANDKTDFEALYKGLEVALNPQKMGYSRDNSNLMIVIGDAGNDLNDSKCLTQEEIIKKCVENRIQLTSFLVRNIDSPASQQFRKQMCGIVMNNMKRQYAKLGNNIKIKWNQLSDGYDFKLDQISGYQVDAYFCGGFRNALEGQDMDESRLYSLVNNTMNFFEESMAKLINILVDSKEIATISDNDKDKTASDIKRNLLIDILGQETYNALKATNYIMAFEGKVPQKSPNGWDYWKPVIYISHPEFLKLMEQLTPVMEAVEHNPEDRKPYVEAMKGLVRSMLPGVSEQMMMKMNNKEIMGQIFGLNVKTEALGKYPLVDIENAQVVTPEKFSGLVSDFMIKYRKLEEIQKKRYPFITKRNGVPFYWIPAEDLP